MIPTNLNYSFFRQIAVLSGHDDWLTQQLHTFFMANRGKSAVYCASDKPLLLPTNTDFYRFSHAKNMLGQEFDIGIYDTRQQNALNFNLEALAIVSATLKAGGILWILLPFQWQQLADWDTLRWSGHSNARIPKHFYHWLQQSLLSYPIRFHQQSRTQMRLPEVVRKPWRLPASVLQQQQQCLQQILAAEDDIYLLVAARGRGKSALAGMLANQLGAEQPVFLTSANQHAVQVLYRYCLQHKPHFIAPDELLIQLAANPNQFSKSWLIIDEAAMIPLEMLTEICRYFAHILLTTTLYGYEGTGRGFELKLTQQLNRTWRRLSLQQPLRYPQQDPLEQWINRLLLLDLEWQQVAGNSQVSSSKSTEISVDDLRTNAAIWTAFYRLLSLAHYRTTPLDLRRLLDADGQRFWLTNCGDQIVAGIWALQEGGIMENSLIEQIWRGERRPKGNLLVQSLCFQADLPQACMLQSLRISRIAVLPNLQQQGLGSQLIQCLRQDTQHDLDFISVSFGYSLPLAHFWQKCGFQIVHVSSGKEASSGCYSVMAVYPCSPDGERFCQQAQRQFLRNFPLAEHPLFQILQDQMDFPEIDWMLNDDDWRQLQGFAYTNRTLAATYPALQRLRRSTPHIDWHIVGCKKQRLLQWRKAVAQLV